VKLQYLLDTSVVSNPIAARPDPNILRQLEELGHSCSIAAVVWHELVYGCRRLPAGKRRAAVEAYLDEVVLRSFPILDYTEPAATWHAGERARLEAAGRPAPFVDGQIAAIACVNDLVLVTTNVRDFERFKDLEVVDWSKRRH
jgi:tRNA(fMet)-specific endonuclease VapC